MKEEQIIDLPGDDDENVGNGVPKKKKEKKIKSKIERQAERKVVFWTLLIVLIVTLLFWLIPVIKSGNFSLPLIKLASPSVKVYLPKPDWKGYVEYKL